MDLNKYQYVKSLMGIESGSEIELVFDSLTDQAPIVGKLLTSYKIHRLGKRLNNFQSQLEELNERVSNIGDLDFIDFLKSFLFPSLLENMLNEDEDNKIEFFINGFAHVVDFKINDKSRVLIYFDVLRELRFLEIEYLISLTSEYKKHLLRENNGRENLHEMFRFEKLKQENKEFRNLYWSIDNKLERLGLIDSGKLINFYEILNKLSKLIEKENRGIGGHNWPEKVEITNFGKSFFDFFYLLEKYKE